MNKSIVIGILISTTLISCGGDSADPTTPTTNNSSGSAGETPGQTSKITLPRYEIGDIKHTDVPALTRTLVYAIADEVSYDEPASGGPPKFREDLTLETGPFSEDIPCDVSGSATMSGDIQSKLVSTDGEDFRILTSGDWTETIFNDCAGGFGYGDTTVNGKIRTSVVSGYYDGWAVEEIPIEPGTTKKIRVNYSEFIISYAGAPKPNYVHGDLTITTTTEKTTHSGTYWAARAVLATNLGNTIVEQFETTLESYELSSLKSSPKAMYGKARVGGSLLGYAVDVAIIEPLESGSISRRTRVFKSGAIRAKGTSSTLMLNFHENYFSFQLDSNNDGDFEAVEDIFWEDIFPFSGN